MGKPQKYEFLTKEKVEEVINRIFYEDPTHSNNKRKGRKEGNTD